MRGFFALLLVVGLLMFSFSGCSKLPKSDVWDGSIAENFAEGDGSEKQPYIIEKASQLAFLAQEVNAGVDYRGKYIILTCDLDLNNQEWTPIGNGTHYFNGTFDGNGCTISNLKITNGAKFTTETSRGETNQYTAGLFGSCLDATITNITIDKAKISIQNITDSSVIMGGVLIGTMCAESLTEISNVNVVDANITCLFELKSESSSLRVGGVVGYVYGNDYSAINIENINTVAAISIAKGKASYNLVGGIVGAASINKLCNVNNCASYLSINIDTQNSYMQKNYFGAFGSMSTRNDIVSISNVFSEITTNKIQDVSHGYFAYEANAIIGETHQAKQSNGAVFGGYSFENLFGYIKQVNAAEEKSAKSTQLYNLPSHVIYTEKNCLGCESLPPDHSFDASVWNLTDLSHPKIDTK